MRACVLEDDRRLRGSFRHLSDEHRSRIRRRLDSGRGVDEVARDHPLTLGTERHRGLSGEHSGARPEIGRCDFCAERRHRRREVERGPYGAFGVVLLCHRRPPDGHHGVADELLDRPAVALDRRSCGFEVAREQLADVLGVTSLREGRVPDEVGEEDGDEAALG